MTPVAMATKFETKIGNNSGDATHGIRIIVHAAPRCLVRSLL